jgi:hypothetical protein
MLMSAITVSVAAYVSIQISNKQTMVTDSNNSEQKQLDNNGSALNGEYQTMTRDEVLADLKKAQVNVTDKLSSFISFPSGLKGTKGSWVVENVKENNVIEQCEIQLGDKLIAKTPPIHPNQHIKNIELLEQLEPGSYDVVAYISYFNLETKDYISKAGYKIKLSIG